VGSVAVAFTAPRTVRFLREDAPLLSPGDVRLRTLYSGVSAGTELTAYRGTNPYLNKHWDAARRLFVEGTTGEPQYPLVGWGYEEAGEVVECGPAVNGLPRGSIVYGTWGHRSEAVMDAGEALQRVLPDGVDPILGIFSHIGAIALNGVLDGEIRPGDVVAVFGLGVVGNLVAQIARRAGGHVVGIDLLPSRRDIASRVGVEVLDPGSTPPGEALKDATGGRGADVCIEASGSTAALHQAIRACAYSSRVVALGFYQGEATGLSLGEEFHHNRITIVSSQIGGIAPGLQHRWDRPRLIETFMRTAIEGEVELRPLITHVVPAAEAPEVFRLLDERPSEVLQAVLDFRVPFPPKIATSEM
jgi:2-desacetyl-2-hydroxyethyl bacteriochlorophyllide A dehydrogenase